MHLIHFFVALTYSAMHEQEGTIQLFAGHFAAANSCNVEESFKKKSWIRIRIRMQMPSKI